MIVTPNFNAPRVASFLTGFNSSKESWKVTSSRFCEYAERTARSEVPEFKLFEPIHFQTEEVDTALDPFLELPMQSINGIVNDYIELVSSPTRYFAVFVFPAIFTDDQDDSEDYFHLTVLELAESEVEDFEKQVLALNSSDS